MSHFAVCFYLCFYLFRGSRDVAKVSMEDYSSPNKVQSCSENISGKLAAIPSPDRDATGMRLFY